MQLYRLIYVSDVADYIDWTDLKDILLNKGFNPTVIENGNFVRVVIGVFNDRDLAITELQRIRNQYDHSVWLLEEQN